MLYTFEWYGPIKECAVCPFEVVEYDEGDCVLAGKSTKDVRLQFSRPLWCPLIEGGVKTEEVKQDGE